ncbi:MAG TPA: FtsX-like permease family protein [Puia sp.]|nr:FtsX-like permease family protein [Puia sp.]
MLKRHFTLAFRHLRQNKMHAILNIAGLSAGMAVTILISLWIVDECSYDQYNPAYNRIARVMQTGTLDGSRYTYSSMPIPLADELRTRYGGAFKYVVPAYWARDYVLSGGDGVGDKKITQKGRFMDIQAPYLLSLTMLQGSRDALQDPSSVLLSASAVKDIFGATDPMGQTLKIDNTMSVKVAGVYEDLPANSNFGNVHFIAAWKLLLSSDDPDVKPFQRDWGWDATEIYVQLADKADADRASTLIRNSTYDHLKGDRDRAAYHPLVFLQPMSRWHLYAEYKDGVNTGGEIKFVWLFGLIGTFVLLLACINFMNLSTARSEKRAKEVGIRKAIGSRRMQLVAQFFSESFMAALMAYVCAVMLVFLSLPYFNQVTGKRISIAWDNPWFWLAGMGCTLFTGLVAGSYPAFYLSSFRPIKVLKGNGGFRTFIRVSWLAAIPRKALVVLQFTVSVALIIGVLVVFRQVVFTKNRPAGYDREGLISIPVNTPEVSAQQMVLRDALLKTGAITDMAASSSPATAIWLNLAGFDWPGKIPGAQAEFGAVAVTQEYGKTVGWQFLRGRDFSRAFLTDSTGLVLNEAAVKYMGLKDPVGVTVQWDGKPFHILGVIRDMLMESPYEPVHQVIYYLPRRADTHFLIARLQPGLPVSESLARIRSIFQKYVPSAPFEYKFVDEEYDKKFASEERTGKLAGFFAILAVFISCLGIFGMASFMAEQRTKEIGIRKVLGATVVQVWGLLLKDFLVLLGIALCIALPCADYFMSRWLQQYPYHSGIPWWVIAGTALGALLITITVVSGQAVKAAVANPVRNLRSE